MINISFVGLGSFAIKKLHELSNCSDVNVISCVDTSSAAIARFYTEFSTKDTLIYRDLSTLLKNSFPDIILISTTSPTHTVIAEHIIKSGYQGHILIEKPLSNSLKKALALQKFLKSIDYKFITIDFARRQSPIYLKISDIVLSQKYGKLKKIKTISNGTVSMQGIHFIDTAIMISKKNPISVKAELKASPFQDTHRGNLFDEPYGVVDIEFEDDIFLQMDFRRDLKQHDKIIEFLFEDFSIKLTKNESEIIISKNPSLQKEFSNITLKSNQSLCDFVQLIKHMYNNNYDLLCSIDDGIKSLSVIAAAFLSNDFNTKIFIPIESKFHDMELKIG